MADIDVTNVVILDVIRALIRVALNQNSNTVFLRSTRSSDGLNLKWPTEMAEIKVAKKTIFFPRKDSWSSPQIITQGDFHIGQVLINKYGLKT